MILRPLPTLAMNVMERIRPSWPLLLHHYLVHDVAVEICAGMRMQCPTMVFDADAVLAGAATHDLGKLLHPNELHSPGRRHQRSGERLLRSSGLRPALARFALTHGATEREYPALPIEDLLVALADRAWSGSRKEALEREIMARVQSACNLEPWDAFHCVDGLVAGVSERSALRLGCQQRSLERALVE
jgi:hypothetical protein